MKVRIRGKTIDIPAVWWDRGKVAAIDQTALPRNVKIIRFSDHLQVAKAIRDMRIRGAPTIGAAVAYGLALAAKNKKDLNRAADLFRETRPTAHDLFYAIEWMMAHMDDPVDSSRQYADRIVEECRSIGRHGLKLIKDGMKLLTHCNAGALATVDYGTALAPIRLAHDQGRNLFVFVDETRPRLQGANLTSWELEQEGIPHAIITDNAAGHFLKSEIDLVIVGGDRIARNGDFANKIGTYEKAVVAKENDVPFYVAAPMSTFDPDIDGEKAITIEERDESEVLRIGATRIGPVKAKALNPAFDVTPARYVTGFITDGGIIDPEKLNEILPRRGAASR